MPSKYDYSDPPKPKSFPPTATGDPSAWTPDDSYDRGTTKEMQPVPPPPGYGANLPSVRTMPLRTEISKDMKPGKPQYLTDDWCVLALTGLKYVTKSDENWGGEDKFRLTVGYKGKDVTIHYRSKYDRDDLFFKIRAALAYPPPTVSGH